MVRHKAIWLQIYNRGIPADLMETEGGLLRLVSTLLTISNWFDVPKNQSATLLRTYKKHLSDSLQFKSPTTTLLQVNWTKALN